MKLKLDMEEMAEAFFEDTRLLGIVAPIKDYQFLLAAEPVVSFQFPAEQYDRDSTDQKVNPVFFFCF